MNGYGVENPATPQETIPVKLGESYKSRFGNDNVSVDCSVANSVLRRDHMELLFTIFPTKAFVLEESAIS